MFDNSQLRGAFGAGYEKGFQDGREALHKLGWKTISSPKDVPAGSIIKILVPSVFGWKGEARVVYANDEVIHAHRLENPDMLVDCCLHEAVVKV